jgi:Ala-tRNA(Pro) deacylase
MPSQDVLELQPAANRIMCSSAPQGDCDLGQSSLRSRFEGGGSKSTTMPASSVLEAIRERLISHGVPFREVHHPPTLTSEQSALARGEELRVGGKALLLKGEDEEYRLFVLPADRKIDSAAIRKRLGVKRLRFANADELMSLTGLVPGSVPPFGRPILPFDLYVDEAIRSNERIAFNAGSLTDSMILGMTDYLRIAQPTECFPFSALS